MNTAFILIPILLPIIFGAILLWKPIEDDHKRNLAVETLVIINTIIAMVLILNPPADRLELFRLVGDLSISFKLDGMARVFGGMVACLWPLASLYAFDYMSHEERKNTFFAFYTMTFGVTLGIAFSGDLITMYLCYEMLTLVTLPLVIHTMTEEAKQAAKMYLYYMIGGTAFAFMGIVYLTMHAENVNFTYGGILSPELATSGSFVMLLMYLFMFGGFGVKAAVFPFQKWLPAASVAPTPVTALLHAVAVVKSGVYAIMRVTYFCFGADTLKGTWVQYVVMALAMITICYGSTMGVKELHFKRRLAYSTISNLSYILLAVTAMSPLGLVAALTHMLFHAVTKISAFFCAGAVMHRSDKNYIYELDGMGYKMPFTFATLLIDGLSLTGIPLFAGFISKWNIAAALLDDKSPLAVAAIVVLLYSALMTGIYMMTIIFRAFFPKVGYDESNLAHIHPGNWRMRVPLAAFSIAIFYFGLHAQPVIDLAEKIAAGLM